ncbi:MAG: hypothetical protein HY865_22240 [Chloroflexi bacterium]|nr:hypothetical protein [Chloroflexota bacterium]
MPCFSTIPTKLLDVEMIKKAVAEIGAKITSLSPNNIVVEKGKERISLERSRSDDNYSVALSRSSYNCQDLLETLTISYAKNTVKAWAKKNGYTFSAGSKPGEYVMTQYTGG